MSRSSIRYVIAAAAVLVAAVVTVVVAVAVLWPGDDGDDAEAPAVTVPGDHLVSGTAGDVAMSAPADTSPPSSEPVGGSLTLVASFAADTPSFDGPNGKEVGVVPAMWHDRPSVLPVIDEAPGWLQVRLAQRPNGSTAWVRSADVELASTPFRVVIDVATTRLRVFESGVEILDAPAGVGTVEAPTTLGSFFVAFMQEPPDTTSGWGPFVVVTSSHSETISDFESSGDAIAAIHGPLGAADKIGDSGARVSHGCIRLLLDDLEVLRQLPAGTPIDVIDSSAPLPDDSSVPVR